MGVSDGCCEGAVVGQDEASHVAISFVVAHIVPPPLAGIEMVRVLCCDPVPHVTKHKPHACQTPISQSTGQLEEEHVLVSDSTGHCKPPSLSRVSIILDRVALAAPQLTEQEVHEAQTPMAQSMGQTSVPHTASSIVTSRHAAPKPACGRATLRARDLEPESQLREHAFQAAHAASTQSIETTGAAAGEAVVGVGVGVGLNANSPNLTRQYDSNDPSCLRLALPWIHANVSPLVPPCVPERIDGRTSASAMKWERAWVRASKRHRTEQMIPCRQ
jgi:hypothetical protein